MADLVIKRFLKDQVTGIPSGLPASYADLWTNYMDAGAAMIERRKGVTITSHSLGGSTNSGQITGDPRELCESFQEIIDEALGTTAPGAGHSFYYRSRWSRT